MGIKVDIDSWVSFIIFHYMLDEMLIESILYTDVAFMQCAAAFQWNGIYKKHFYPFSPLV